MLEEEFISTLNYVELDVINFSTISLKYINLLLSIGAELDNFFKVSCNLEGRKTINDYINPVLIKYSKIIGQTVLIKTYNISLIPYKGWDKTAPSQSLGFWEKYNNVKHDRISNYSMASLETVINALAGLYILEVYMYNDIYLSDTSIMQNIPEEESKLFVLENLDVHIRTSCLKSENDIYDDETGNIIVNKS